VFPSHLWSLSKNNILILNETTTYQHYYRDPDVFFDIHHLRPFVSPIVTVANSESEYLLALEGLLEAEHHQSGTHSNATDAPQERCTLSDSNFQGQTPALMSIWCRTNLRQTAQAIEA
tara:strand:- start:18961 stop:19314 length:354 start_codon:yes stop_codon:yes gene_type:complete